MVMRWTPNGDAVGTGHPMGALDSGDVVGASGGAVGANGDAVGASRTSCTPPLLAGTLIINTPGLSVRSTSRISELLSGKMEKLPAMIKTLPGCRKSRKRQGS